MKQQKKVNPYEKKAARKPLRITRKHWIIAASVLAVVAILIGFACFGPGADPHAGHNHGDENTSTADPHAGHNHAEGEDCSTNTGNNTHTGNTADRTGVLTYRAYTNADKSYRVQVVDKNNKVVFEKDKMYRGPFEENVSEDVFCLSWATGEGPNDFEAVFWNKKTGQLSSLFWAPRGFDAQRIAYPSADQTKVIVQDIFNKNGYHQEYTLENAAEKNGNIIVGGALRSDKKSVAITYQTKEEGKTAQLVVGLYK